MPLAMAAAAAAAAVVYSCGSSMRCRMCVVVVWSVHVCYSGMERACGENGLGCGLMARHVCCPVLASRKHACMPIHVMDHVLHCSTSSTPPHLRLLSACRSRLCCGQCVLPWWHVCFQAACMGHALLSLSPTHPSLCLPAVINPRRQELQAIPHPLTTYLCLLS